MHTNLFLVLRDALAWVAAHPGAALALTVISGDLKVTAQLPLPGEGSSWKVVALDLNKSFATDPTPRVTATPAEVPLTDRIGAELRAYLSKPLGPEALAKTLMVADAPVTVAVLARAAALQAQLDAGQSIDPFPAPPARVTPRVRIQDLLRGG